MASSISSSPSSLLLPLGSASEKKLYANHMAFSNIRAQAIIVRSSSCKTRKYSNGPDLVTRRGVMGLLFGVPIISLKSPDADGAGLPPEEKPKLCDDACEKELENVPMVTTESGLQYKDIKVGQGPSPPVGFQVAANYVAMVPSGQIFDSSLEKGQPYIFRVGSGQVIKGLDEGILSMKIGGKRRLYIPGPYHRGPCTKSRIVFYRFT